MEWTIWALIIVSVVLWINAALTRKDIDRLLYRVEDLEKRTDGLSKRLDTQHETIRHH